MTNKDKGMPLIKSGFSQTYVAEYCGVSRQAVFQWVYPERRRAYRARLAAERTMRRAQEREVNRWLLADMNSSLNDALRHRIERELAFQRRNPSRWQRFLRWLGLC